MKALTFLHMSMLKELIQEKHSREKSKSNERGVCPSGGARIFRDGGSQL